MKTNTACCWDLKQNSAFTRIDNLHALKNKAGRFVLVYKNSGKIYAYVSRSSFSYW